MVTHVRVKHESDDVYNVETDSESDDIDVEKLQPLAPKFASLSKFPVGCKVWYNLRCSTETKHFQAKSAHVEKVSIHFENGRRVYTVKSETSSEHKTSLYEDQLVYAISCPVKVTKIDADETKNETWDGVVVYLERQKGSDGRQQVTYAVQYSVENYITIESGVTADRIKYREEDSGMGVDRTESNISINKQIQTTCAQGEGIISVEEGGAKKPVAKEGKGGAAAKRRSPPKESAPAGLKAPPETSGADVIRLYQGGDAKELKEPSSAKTDSPRPQNQTELTASTQVSMSVNQQLPSTVQSLAAAGAYVRPQSSSTDPAAAVTTDAFPSKPRFNSTIRILSGEFAGLIGQITNIKIGGWCSIANPQVTKPIRMSNMEVLARNDFPPPVVKRDATYSKRKFADVDVSPTSSHYGKRDSSVRRSKRGPTPNPRFHHDNDDEEDNNDEEEVVRPRGRRGRAAATATPSSSSSSTTPGKKSIHLCKALTCPKFRQGSCQGYCTTCFKLFKPGSFDSHQQPQRGGSARNCRARKCTKFIQHNCEGYCMKHYREFVLEGGEEEEEEVEEKVVVSPLKKRARRTIEQEVEEEEEEEEEELDDDNNDDESPFDDTPRTGRNGCTCRRYCKVKRCDKWSQGQPKNGMCFKHFRHYGFGDGTTVRPPVAATTPSKASSTSGKKEVSSPPKTWNVEEEEEEEEELLVDTGLSSFGEREAVAAAAAKRRGPPKESAPVGLKSPPEKSNHSELKEPLSANTDSTFIPPVISPSEKDKAKSEEWKRGAKKPSASVGDEDSLAEEQRKEKDLKKKASEKINNFLNAWLLRPENVQSNPIAAATPTTDAKEHIAKQLGVDRRRIDTWFYRRRKKLKKQHIAAQADMPQTQTQAKPAKAKPPSISKNQFSINPNINLPSHHLGLQDITASPELVRVKEESVSQSAVDTRERLCSTQEECAVPSPRTTMEVLQSDNYSGSHYCVQCARRKKLCVFDGDKQKCQLCEVDGLSCQVLGKTWLHSHAESKLGRRSSCVCCAIKKKKCSYSDNDEYNFNTTCNKCTREGVPCWVGVNYRGMRNHTTLLSGVHETIVAENHMQTLVASVVFDAVANIKAANDNSKNFDAQAGTIRAWTNYRECLEEKVCKETIGCGSRCSPTRDGSTHKLITDDMGTLRAKLYSILQQHSYLAPFLKEFNHVQFNIYGDKVLQQNKTCQYMQTEMPYSFSKKNGIQCLPPVNSPEFNTIVATINVGHARNIKFERVAWDNGTTGDVLETRYFILPHLSLFVLHPLDERPALRDRNRSSKVLSIWRHGDTKMLCNNPSCRGRCDGTCQAENEYIASYALVLRCSRIDTETDTDPLFDQPQLPRLSASHRERMRDAATQLEEYSHGESFSAWLLHATQKVEDDFHASATQKDETSLSLR